MPTFTKIKERITELWNKLDKSQKGRVYIISAILVVAITVSIVLLTRTTYVPLITIDEDASNASEIEEVLKENDIDYKPGEGNKILVNSKEKNKAEFALASAGLSSSRMMFEDAWNLVNITSTESDKKQLWQNFKKNNLVAKLKMFDNVRDADIEVTMPEDSLFFSGTTKEEATAFVRIDAKGDITPEQVKGIVSVVAASVEGLDPSNVTVVDNNFNVMSSDLADGIGDTSTQYKMKLMVKEELEQNIKVLYPSRSDSYDYISVVVNPVLRFDKEKTIKTEVAKPTDIDEAIVSSNTQKEELTNGSEGEVPGIDSNPADGTVVYPADGGEESNYKNTITQVNRDFNRTETEVEKALGDINFESSSVAVTLWYGQRVADDSAITPEFLEQCQQVISGATNIPVSKISISKYKLAPEDVYEESLSEKIQQYVNTYGLFIIFLILIIGMAIAILPRRKKEVAAGEEFDVEGAEVAALNLGDEVEDVESIAFAQKSEVRKQLEKFVSEKPESVAQLLRNWLTEDWE